MKVEAHGCMGAVHFISALNCRRSAASSERGAAGISLRVVQDIGGWSTLRMLERYAHPSGAEMSRAVRVLTAYTTRTKPGTTAKNGKRDRKKSSAASGAET